MGKTTRYYLPLLLAIWVSLPTQAIRSQSSTDKVWFNGLGRAFFAQDQLKGDVLSQDSTTARSSNGGHMLLDLNVHVNPSPKLEISSLVRFRTEFGGFWGSGTSVQLRQMYLRGILGKGIHYSIGDLYLHQSRFTLFNTRQEGTAHQAAIFSPYSDIVDYENFYLNNDWRLQGMQTDFSINFTRFIRAIDVDAFIARNRGSVWLGAPDELFGGASIVVRQSKVFDLGFNTVSLFEIPSTSNGSTAFHNPVNTVSANYRIQRDSMEIALFAEAGMSVLRRTGDSLAPPDLSGSFAEGGISLDLPKHALKLKLAYRAVSPGFRSAGAQTKRFQFDGSNTVFPRLTDAQMLRPAAVFDLLSDDLRYNQSLSQNLMAFDPKYNNATPYGDATPNRAGVHLNADFAPASDRLSAFAVLGYSQELQGQGTLELKNFLAGQAGVNVNLHKMLDWKRKLKLTAGILAEQTSRGGDSLAQVSLSSLLADIGGSLEVMQNLDLMMGVKLFQANGNDYLSRRNEYGELVDLPVYLVDETHGIYAAGVRYNFREDIYLQLNGNWISVQDRVGTLPKYQIQRFLIVFNMNL
jgi:hypothetical protein